MINCQITYNDISSFNPNGSFKIKHNDGYCFFVSDNILYKYNERYKRWQPTCYYSHDKCFNFCSTGTFYCKKHQNNILNNNDQINAHIVGNELEELITKILEKNESLINVTNIGQENSMLDIIYQVRSEIDVGITHYRGIQVRTLWDVGYSYVASGLNNYNSDTLILYVNKERTCFFICFKYLGNSNNSISIPKSNIYNVCDVIKPFIFNGLTYEFFLTFFYYLKYSTIYNPTLQTSHSCLKEKNMLVKLQDFCMKNNLSFRINNTHMSSIDCYINDHAIQCKFSSVFDGNLLAFKLNHTVNNVNAQPYHQNDGIDFFIFEHEKELNFFRIIPCNTLIYFRYIATVNQNGKTTINLHSKDSIEIHWTKDFINNFEILINGKHLEINYTVNTNDIFVKFQSLCIKKGYSCVRNTSNLSFNNCYVNGKSVKFFDASKKAGLNYIFVIRKIRGFSVDLDNDIPNFFVFRISEYPDDFYIFSKETFIYYGVIGSNGKPGVTDLGLPVPGYDHSYKNKKWLSLGLNNF